MSNLWNIISESNLFNFILLVVIAMLLFEKLNVSELLEKMKNSIIKRIKDSEQAKADAKENLNNANLKVKNLNNEITEKLELATTRANNVADMINDVTKRKVNQIAINSKRVIENDGKTLISILSDKTASNSIESAEKYIKNRLKLEPSLHEKYINESIENLEKVLL